MKKGLKIIAIINLVLGLLNLITTTAWATVNNLPWWVINNLFSIPACLIFGIVILSEKETAK